MDTEGWGYNDGDGCETQEECDRLADALESELQSFVGEEINPFPIDVEGEQTLLVGASGLFLSREEAQEMLARGEVVRSPYGVRREDLQEFIAFLRNCGGFHIC